ncbi:MAG: antitoxin VapB family protein [Euryarchaeota archaeon]|nr:antitoxin VapB family protein [Euryarchaeota archaeon]
MGEITIPIKEEVYKALLMEKEDKEGLSEVILRLSKKNLCIEDVVGTQILSKEDWDEVKRELKRASNLTLKKLGKERV